MISMTDEQIATGLSTKDTATQKLLMGTAICEVLSSVVKRSALHHGGKRQKVTWS